MERSNRQNFKATVRLWRWPGDGGWHFITLDKKVWREIRSKHPKGMIPIEARIGKSIWKTSLLPHIKSESYLIAIKASVRKEEGIFEGELLKIEFRIL